MEPPSIPEVRFDPDRAQRIFPRPVLKHAVLVPIPKSQDDADIPTFIRPEWGGVQVFYGDYYGIITGNGDAIGYGSAREQWELMHAQIQPGYWVKTCIPTAYQAVEVCRIVTLIPSDDGGIREANFALQPGDWIVRQPGAEVQHIKAQKFPGIYFTQEEAVQLGLVNMTVSQFSDWALPPVEALVPSA